MADPYTHIIRPATPLDYRAIVNTVNALNPEWPSLTVQRLEADRASLPADSFLESHVAERDDQVIGDAFWYRLPYIDEQSVYWFTIHIHPDR